MVGHDTSVRASPAVLSLVAERQRAYELGSAPDAMSATADGVDRVVVDTIATQWTPPQWLDFASGMVTRGYRVLFSGPGVVVYARGGS
jgi:hypothetical protein